MRHPCKQRQSQHRGYTATKPQISEGSRLLEWILHAARCAYRHCGAGLDRVGRWQACDSLSARWRLAWWGIGASGVRLRGWAASATQHVEQAEEDPLIRVVVEHAIDDPPRLFDDLARDGDQGVDERFELDAQQPRFVGTILFRPT